MKILITGANGQLGSELHSLSSLFPHISFIFTDVNDLDITNARELIKYANENPFDVIINCAAYTAVDKAEQEQDLAYQINVEAVKNLSLVCNQFNALLIHISTDYVFSGNAFQPYNEGDKPNPQSVYAKTKLQAEKSIQEICQRAIVVRTSWLYSGFGNNFVKTMIKYGKEREQLNVVFDQIGSPTYAAELAKTLIIISEKSDKFQGFEVFHYSNEGVCSWYDFAIAIMEEQNIDCKVLPILSKEYPLPAKRPFYSVLDKSKIKATFALEIPHWKVSLKDCLRKINNYEKRY